MLFQSYLEALASLLDIKSMRVYSIAINLTGIMGEPQATTNPGVWQSISHLIVGSLAWLACLFLFQIKNKNEPRCFPLAKTHGGISDIITVLKR